MSHKLKITKHYRKNIKQDLNKWNKTLRHGLNDLILLKLQYSPH